MSAYSIFSLTALLLKIALAVKLIIDKQKVNAALLWLLIFLFILNLLEYLALSGLIFSDTTFKIFYVILILTLAHILVVINTIMNRSMIFPFILLVIGSFLAAVLFSTDLVVAGTKVGGIGYTAIRGEYYYLFQAYAISCLGTAAIYIYKSVKATYNHKVTTINRAKSAVILLSLLPFVLGISIIIVLMAAGFNVNAAVLIPITTTIFLFGCFYAMSSKILDYSIFIPYTPSWNAKKDLLYFLYSTPDKTELWDHLISIERSFIEEAMQENDGKITKAAEALGCTGGKLDYRIKKIHKLKN